MPVTPLPPSNTERWFLDYTVIDTHHVLIMRTADAVSDGAAAEALDTFLSAIAPGCSAITIDGLRHAAATSDLTFPASTTGLSATYGSGVGQLIDIPLQATFTGRSTDGRKARVGMFGWDAQTDSSWRYTTAENANVAATIAALNSLSASGFFVSISGGGVIYHPYMNIGYNDHWVDKRRAG